MKLMPTLAERILEAIRFTPLDDDVLSRRLGLGHRQSVNQAARRLEAQGRLRRLMGPDGKIVNALPDQAPQEAAKAAPVPAATRPHAAMVTPGGVDVSRITEDEVKEAVRAHLAAQGFDVAVAWGHVRGIDIDARHSDGRRYVVEAKAEVGRSGAQQVNYFLGMLGELCQRMDDPDASYGIALPANKQYRGLVGRLPALARQRLRLAVFWVSRQHAALVVEVDS